MIKVNAFDFDGTITTRDTLIEFIRYAHGSLKFYMGFLLYSPLLVLMKLGLLSNCMVKMTIFRHFFGGMKIDVFDTLCRDFAANNASLLRPQALQTISQALTNGEKVLVVSASIDNWVKPFFCDYAHVQVMGTQIEVVNGVVTGRFSTPNCYGAEKVNRINKLLPDRDSYTLTAYGDSRGDKELLDYADKGFFKPFR